MKHRSRFARWFCLMAYLWTATGLSQATFVSALIDTHPRASVIIEAAPDGELLLHHIGHRDAHEPNAIDHEHPATAGMAECCGSHADHVVKLDGEAQRGAPSAKDSKSPPSLPASLFAAKAFADSLTPPRLPSPDATAQIASRNTSLAFVKLTQLRL